ncbi:restriction endonuclease subunit S [Streptomyces sp. M92]|uniref:restriction endonuclease subunit S n=1 Tax=Streptomyces sp. M92 TaxID=2944250 RepID=UPI00234A78FE|nr:restriction endonuclease subunit S [Streptomyces sp. M92]WCN07383.1 restriction endonuclease subunit S [Streptomyces sp. M92]
MNDVLLADSPSEWRRTTLAAACSDGGGIQTGPFGSQLHASDYVEKGIPSVMPQDLGENVIREDAIAHITPADAQRLSKYLLRNGDIVYSRRGDVTRRALVRLAQEGWLCGTGCLRVRPGAGVNSLFLSYYLGHPEVRDWITRHAVGATMPNLNTQILGAVPVVLPEPREQQAIAALLGALDDKIAVNERISATYEQILRYKYTVMGLSDEPDNEHAIPVTDLITFNPKLTKPSTDEPVYVDMAALQTDKASIPNWTRRAPKSGPRFMNGDTLMARITPCLENGKTGYVNFMKDGEVGLGSTEFIVMRSRDGVPRELSYFLARDKRFRAHAIRNMAGTSGRQRVSATDVANYFVNRPNAEALANFGEEAAAAFSHVKSLQSENRLLATLRDTLLPQLMSGRLRVKDAEKIVEDHV